MRLFSYKMKHDTGFAPNPFNGVMTLATCKPGMRRTKGIDDWIAGFSSKTLTRNAAASPYDVTIASDALIYVSRVSNIMSIPDYFLDSRFEKKKPIQSSNAISKVGDNIYKPLVQHPCCREDYEQLESEHGEGDVERDLGGLNVLIFQEFYYLGREGKSLPDSLLIQRPAGPSCYGCKTDDEHQINALLKWVRYSYNKEGQIGTPCMMTTDGFEKSEPCGTCRQ